MEQNQIHARVPDLFPLWDFSHFWLDHFSGTQVQAFSGQPTQHSPISWSVMLAAFGGKSPIGGCRPHFLGPKFRLLLAK